jgi:hypothetical protein
MLYGLRSELACAGLLGGGAVPLASNACRLAGCRPHVMLKVRPSPFNKAASVQFDLILPVYATPLETARLLGKVARSGLTECKSNTRVRVLLRDVAREALIGCIGHLRLIRIALSAELETPTARGWIFLVDDVRWKIHVSDELQ